MQPISGFTLLEVLVSLVILSFVIVGFEAMQLYALHETRKAYYFSEGISQINSMIERLHTGLDVSTQINQWNDENRRVLPQGRGDVKGQYPAYHITLFWGEMLSDCLETQWGQNGCITMDVNI